MLLTADAAAGVQGIEQQLAAGRGLLHRGCHRAGVAGSLARNDSDLDGTASRLKADQRSLALYGLWRGNRWFVDGLLGLAEAGSEPSPSAAKPEL